MHADQVLLIAGERMIPALPLVKEKAVTLDELENMARGNPQTRNATTRSAARRRPTSSEDCSPRTKTRSGYPRCGRFSKNQVCPPNGCRPALARCALVDKKPGRHAVSSSARTHLRAEPARSLACTDPECPHRQKKLGDDWPCSAVWTQPREHRSCGIPSMKFSPAGAVTRRF